ncbi:hypothetical protein EMCRGX_G034127, partial [Ephydatia muelleri]
MFSFISIINNYRTHSLSHEGRISLAKRALEVEQTSITSLAMSFGEGKSHGKPLEEGPPQLLPLEEGPSQLLPLEEGPSQLLPLEEGSRQLLPLEEGPSQLL